MKKKANLDIPDKPSTAFVHALSHDGRGIATLQNKTTFIAGALPNETVTYQLTRKRGTYNEAEVADIITPSDERLVPPCQHFGLCGGCSLQHMSINAQLQMKQQALLEQLKHFGQVTPNAMMPPLSAASTGYRRKARLGVKFVIKKDKMLVGFREKSSRYLADIESCIVLHPKVGTQLIGLEQLVLSLETYQQIPQIEMAMGDETTALVFRHLTPLPETDIQKLISFGKTQGFAIYLEPNPPQAVHQIWPQDQPERLTYTLPDFSLEFLFHPLDFTQINLEMNRLMVQLAITQLALTPLDTVLDLFCGIGNFTLPIARQARHVTGIEGSMEMVERAQANAAHNQISNTRFYAANLFDAKPAENDWMRQQNYDKILLDPPRAGAKEILPFLNTLGAQKIVYISCNPATLARDAGELVNQFHYQLTRVGIINMFPHTSHIEAMAVFDKHRESPHEARRTTHC
ncbi:MAG: hypothetical protein A3E85_02720 [Gammaproteobacteria bacterium RIFCSPHIGHO2_12_FULL_45_12]|nr:MAG: hypothetical protein A3E85_02720 [Gammaproteobacteria bacterium RIFCSPHIGHO2_12_FULL_45_12]